MARRLTANAIQAITGGNVELRPLLQVLQVSLIGGKGGSHEQKQERYRILLSDGACMHPAMLATQLNPHVKSGRIQKGAVVQLLEYICNTVKNTQIIIVLNMEVITSTADIIGDSKHNLSLEKDAAASSVSYQQGAGKSVNPPEPDGFVRPVVSSYQPSPVYSSRGAIAKNEAPARILPISALNPYQGRWAIKARVTTKGDLRRFHNAKGDGKVFSFDLLDANGGEIRATCFNNVADQFNDCIQVGNVYTISKGSLKPAQKSFNHLKNDWEIFLESSSTVEQCFEGDDSIPQQQFDFRPINEIGGMEGNTMMDVIGVAMSISPSNTILRKNGTETQKRSMQLRDFSGCSVELTMWGEFCSREGQTIEELCDSGRFPIVAVKAGRISDFSGKSVGTISTTQLLIDPDLPDAHRLRKWFELEGKNSTAQSISKEGEGNRIEMRKTVSHIKGEGLGRSDKPDWISVKAVIVFVKTDNFCYTACPLLVGDKQCNKKVVRNSDGLWRCDRCDKTVPECDYRYLLSLQIQDHTGLTWITAFQEAAEEILGVSAKELHTWKQEESFEFGEAIQRVLLTQYLFKLRVKEDNYNDEQRVKCTIVKSEKLNYTAESRTLLELILKMSRGEPAYSSVATAADTNHASFCYKCQIGGHLAVECPNGSSRNGSANYATCSGNKSLCFKCGKGGHWASDCPNQVGGGFRNGKSASYPFSRGY